MSLRHRRTKNRKIALLEKEARALSVTAAAILAAASIFFAGCTGSSPSSESGAQVTSDSGTPRETQESCLVPEAPGTKTARSQNGQITVDLSNTQEGYVMVKYTGSSDVQVQITNPDGDVCPYPLTHGSFMAFPLTNGDGNYKIQVLEAVSGSTYAIAVSEDFSVSLRDEFRPFLYPNQYVSYTDDSEAVKLGRELSAESETDLGYVQNVYNYIIEGIDYDQELAENTPTNYIPDIDRTLEKKSGICFDYAALMTAMLRSQAIPTRLEVGYSGDVYHAWISVYLADIGWVDDIISFDGENWTLMDPTLGANNDAEDVKDYVGDGNNYTTKYIY